MGRRWIAVAAAVAGVALMHGTALALLLLWTLDGTPSTVPVNQSTTFTMKATNHDLTSLQRIGCLEVDLPSSFAIEETLVVSVSNDQPWSSWIAGQAVVVHSDNGLGRLSTGESVTFTIRATPTAPGIFSWPNHAHIQPDCAGPEEPGTPLNVTVLPGPTATPSPSLAPTPTPRPTATPTPKPTLPLPTLPLPTLPLPTVRPTLPIATPTQTPSPTPSPASASSRPGESATPAPTLTPGVVPSEPPAPGGIAPGAVRLAPQSARGFDGLGVDLSIGGLLANAHVWSVPAVAIGVPGLLLIVWVALQAAGVLAWIPAVRRMRGDDEDRRSPRSRQGMTRR